MKSERRRAQTEEARCLHDELPLKLQRAMDLGSEKGASAWLMTLPIAEHNFALHKGSFQTHFVWGMAEYHLVCEWIFLLSMPSVALVVVCPLSNTMTSGISQPNSWLRCAPMCLWNPPLQSLTGESLTHRTSNTDEGTHLDIRFFWGAGINAGAYFDVRVFNPLAPSNCRSSLTSTYMWR